MSAGGDFYDAFLLDDGRVFLAIGDVVGHGVLAAAVMGQVRAGLRVLALQRPDPVQVLAGMDAFVASLGSENVRDRPGGGARSGRRNGRTGRGRSPGTAGPPGVGN